MFKYNMDIINQNVTFFHRIDDILADSESEMSAEEEEKENPKSKSRRKSKEPETFIRESEDMIVDLADPNALSKAISKFNLRK